MPPLLELPFNIAIDLSFWTWFAAQAPTSQVRTIFVLVGWTVVALIFFYMGAHFWVEYREHVKYMHHWEWVLLAIEIPPLYIQTPKAVEQIFAHLSGALITPNVREKFWVGKKQKFFSLEIVSIEGYIQFLIRTEKEFRDLVEAAVYAQYPEAEITEVEDYTEDIPRRYPNAEYDIFGLEFNLANANPYPIRTYPSFEYNLSKEAVFSDPMAAILENFSRIGHGEQLWFQMIIEPVGGSWKEKGIEIVKKIMGQPVHGHGVGWASSLSNAPVAILRELTSIWHWNFENEEHGAEHSTATDVNKLSPGTKALLEAIEEKIAKVGFKSKLRILYVARQDVFNPSRCMDGFVGALNQFNVQSANAIVPHSKTAAAYDWRGYFTAQRKIRFVARYRKRKIKAGATPYILNIEELATIWHFPLPFVKTPLLSKAGAKRGEPPTGLPVESFESPLKRRVVVTQPAPRTEVFVEPPEELPYG